jgi:putative phosphoesterase
MKIALISDVHGNLPALEAVLEHSCERQCDQLWDLGDNVGYGAFPDEVVSLLAVKADRAIIGNYDLKVLKVPKKRDAWSGKKHPLKLFSFEWTHEQLSESSRQYLSQLPEEIEFDLEGIRIQLSHGGPGGLKEPLKPGVPEERFAAAGDSSIDMYLFGHTHVPFARRAAETWFINPGSVGRPDDGDPRASCATLMIGNGTVEVEHSRVEYDVERAVRQAKACGLPEEFSRMLRQGRSLDHVE